MSNIYDGADCCKILTKDIFSYLEVKNIILLNKNVDITIHSSELQVHIWTSAVNGLSCIKVSHDIPNIIVQWEMLSRSALKLYKGLVVLLEQSNLYILLL